MAYQLVIGEPISPALLDDYMNRAGQFIQEVVLDGTKYEPVVLDEIHKSTVQSWENA
jgi:hypothetical protein